MEDLGRETEVGETTEVKQEVVIDGVNNPNMVGETNPLNLLETETGSKEYKEGVENLQAKTTLIKIGKSWKGRLKS